MVFTIQVHRHSIPLNYTNSIYHSPFSYISSIYHSAILVAIYHSGIFTTQLQWLHFPFNYISSIYHSATYIGCIFYSAISVTIYNVSSIYHLVSFIIGIALATLPFGYIGTQTNSVAYEISYIGGIQISNPVVSGIWNWQWY